MKISRALLVLMKVLFVYCASNTLAPPAKPIAEWIEISFSISYLAAALETAGHEVSLVVLRHGGFRREVNKAIADFQPQMVCYTAVATEFPYTVKVAQYMRKHLPDACHAIGGAHVTLRPDDAADGPFDVICVGEGEEAVVELATALESGERPTGIQNLWIKNGEGYEKNPTRPFNSELDEIAFPNREMWRPWIELEPKHTILIGRGCPFTCTYCSNHALWGVAEGNFVRFRSAENVIDELTQLCEEFPKTSYCYFEVETISADKGWATKFCEQLEVFNAAREEPIQFAINLRIHRNADFKDLFADFKKAGFKYIRVGIESGSPRVRQKVLKRTETNEDLISVFKDAHDAGLETFAYNLIGLPGETVEDFMQTVKLNQDCNVTRSYISIFYPYPGTELERVCVERGIKVPPLEDSAERYRARLSLPEFPDRQVEYYFRNFSSLLSGKKEPIFNRIDSFVWRTIRGYPAFERVVARMSGHGILTKVRRATRSVTGIFSTSS